MRFETASLLTLSMALLAGTTQADSISFNASIPNNAPTFLTVGVLPYGVEPSSQWTQDENDRNNLRDNTGAATTLDLDIANFTTSNFNGVIAGNTIYDYGDSHFPGAAADSWTLSQIPYDQYQLIVYVSGNNLVQGSITDGTSTFYWDDASDKSAAAQSFVQITDTDVAGTPVFGNYVVFGEGAPLTGASQVISWDATGGAGAAIVNGFQVVAVPEPTSFAIATVGIGGLLIRRKRN